MVSILGLSLILIGWIPQTWQTIKNKKCQLQLKFAIAYLIGSGLLAYHAYQISDLIFLILNAGATLMALINLFYFRNKSSSPDVKSGSRSLLIYF